MPIVNVNDRSSLDTSSLSGMKWDSTLGALLAGAFISTGLFGLTCVQCYDYFMRAISRKWTQKLFISFLLLLATLDTFFNCRTVYFFVVTNFNNPGILLDRVPWSLSACIFLVSIVNLSVRVAFACKIYKFSHGNLLLTGILAVMSVLDLVLGLFITAKSVQLHAVGQTDRLEVPFILTFLAGTSANVYITSVLSYLLSKARESFSAYNQSLVKTLMICIISTGLLTILDTFLGLFFLAAMPKNFVFLAFFLQLAKLSINAYLTIVNKNDELRESAANPDLASVRMRRIPRATSTTRASTKSTPSKHTGTLLVRVETQTERHRDHKRQRTTGKPTPFVLPSLPPLVLPDQLPQP